MPNKVKPEEARPIRKSRTHSALTQSQSSVFTKYIGKLRVGRTEQLRVSLGVFGADRPAKGFSIGISPDPKPAGSVVTEVLSVGSATRHELFLSITNFGDRPVTVEIWRI